ncbi:hypothetical protein [Actinomadura napierensis]|uniref:Uncharacterized protein n=1 Tax=Actinomadura napierensis TaxID=267854 RepID=A0ABP5K586_9ACTN
MLVPRNPGLGLHHGPQLVRGLFQATAAVQLRGERDPAFRRFLMLVPVSLGGFLSGTPVIVGTPIVFVWHQMSHQVGGGCYPDSHYESR